MGDSADHEACPDDHAVFAAAVAPAPGVCLLHGVSSWPTSRVAAGCSSGSATLRAVDGTSTLQRFTVRVLNAPPTDAAVAAACPRQQPRIRPLPIRRPCGARAAPPQDSAAPRMPPPPPWTWQTRFTSRRLWCSRTPLPMSMLLHNTPVPTVFLWAPSSAPIKPIIEAPQQKSIVATAAAKTGSSQSRSKSGGHPDVIDHRSPPRCTRFLPVQRPQSSSADPTRPNRCRKPRPNPRQRPRRFGSCRSPISGAARSRRHPTGQCNGRPSPSQSLSSGHSPDSTATGHAASAANKPSRTPSHQTDWRRLQSDSSHPSQSSDRLRIRSPRNPAQNSAAPAGKAPAANNSVAPVRDCRPPRVRGPVPARARPTSAQSPTSPYPRTDNSASL